MSMRLVPYAGTERQRLLLRSYTELLEEILLRQRRGRLLSEIGDRLGSREIVRSVLLRWLFEVPDA
jgi:hypothetical protein